MEGLIYYTLRQASAMLQMSESTIKRRIKDGSIPRSKLCGRILIPASFINRLSGDTDQLSVLTSNNQLDCE